MVASKWKVLIIFALDSGTQRYNDLLRRIEGVSPKMLTQTLRSLEKDGLVAREANKVGEQKVEYSLTLLGKTINRPLTELCSWAEEQLDEFEASAHAQAQVGRPTEPVEEATAAKGEAHGLT